MKFAKAVAATLLFVAMPCAAQDGAPPSDPPTVQQLADRWTAAYNQGDAAAIAELYAGDAELYVHREGRFVGRDEIQAYWASDVQVSSPLTFLIVTDSVVDDEMRLVHGNYQVLDRETGVPLGAGRFAHIWVLDETGIWRLDRDVWVDRGEFGPA